MAFNNF